MKHLIPFLLLALAIPAIAEDAPVIGADEVPPPPPMLEGSGDDFAEPAITIRKEADATIEEYRIQGQLYMIKVTPRNAEPYYLVDADGDGQLEHRMHELDPKIMIPAWTIFRW